LRLLDRGYHQRSDRERETAGSSRPFRSRRGRSIACDRALRPSVASPDQAAVAVDTAVRLLRLVPPGRQQTGLPARLRARGTRSSS